MFLRSYSIFALSLLIPLSARRRKPMRSVAQGFRQPARRRHLLSSARISPPTIRRRRRRTIRCPACRPFAFTPMTDRSRDQRRAQARQDSDHRRSSPACRSTRASLPIRPVRAIPAALPDNWNGRLVVAGASGTRSEFNGDFALERLRRAKGLCVRLAEQGRAQLFTSRPAADPLACRLNPASPTLRSFLRQRSRAAIHALGRFHDPGGDTRARPASRQLSASGRATPTRSARRTAATRCAARSSWRPSCSTAASTGKAHLSTSTRRTCSPICLPRSSTSPTTWQSGYQPDQHCSEEHRRQPAIRRISSMRGDSRVALGATTRSRSGKSRSASGRSASTRDTTPMAAAPALTTTSSRLSVSDVGEQVG